MISDMQAVREAAKRLYDMNSTDWRDTHEVASAFLAISDPAPLTEEMLMEKAKVITQINGHCALFFVGVHVVLFPNGWEWRTSDLKPLHITPRTAGDLVMLRMLMEKQ